MISCSTPRPSEVLHDHSYIVDGSPLLAHSELEKHEEKVEENGVCEKEDSDWRYCVLCGVKGDQPPMVRHSTYTAGLGPITKA